MAIELLYLFLYVKSSLIFYWLRYLFIDKNEARFDWTLLFYALYINVFMFSASLLFLISNQTTFTLMDINFYQPTDWTKSERIASLLHVKLEIFACLSQCYWLVSHVVQHVISKYMECCIYPISMARSAIVQDSSYCLFPLKVCDATFSFHSCFATF